MRDAGHLGVHMKEAELSQMDPGPKCRTVRCSEEIQLVRQVQTIKGKAKQAGFYLFFFSVTETAQQATR